MPTTGAGNMSFVLIDIDLNISLHLYTFVSGEELVQGLGDGVFAVPQIAKFGGLNLGLILRRLGRHTFLLLPQSALFLCGNLQ